MVRLTSRDPPSWSTVSQDEHYVAASPNFSVPDSMAVNTHVIIASTVDSNSSVGSDSPTQSLYLNIDDSLEPLSDNGEEEILNVEKVSGRKRRRKKELQANNILFTTGEDGKIIPRLIIPHVIKSDVRLTYANMVAAVYNSCEYNFMVRFMKTYFRPDFTVMQELSGSFPEGMKGKYEIYGLEVNCQYWYERMLDFPDVLFTLKDVKVQINSDEEGVVLIDFTLAGSVYINGPETELPGSSLIDIQDPEKPVYVLGEYEGMLQINNSGSEEGVNTKGYNNYHSNSSTNAYDDQMSEEVQDFDRIFDVNQNTSTDSHRIIDLGIADIPDTEAVLSNEEYLPDDTVTEFEQYLQPPHKISRVTQHPSLSSNSSGSGGGSDHHHHHNSPSASYNNSHNNHSHNNMGNASPRTASPRQSTEAMHAACVSPVTSQTIDAQVNSNRLVKMNQPPVDASPIVQHYCYRGNMRMHFDTDSRVFLNEFFLHAD